MKNKIAIFALLLVCVLTLAACHKKTEGKGTNTNNTTLPSQVTTEFQPKGEDHTHENNGFMCTECGEEFVSQNELLSFIGDVATKGYVIKAEDIKIIDSWYTNTLDEVEITVKADEIAVKANATIASEYFVNNLTASAEGFYEDGYLYLNGKGINGFIQTMYSDCSSVDEEDFHDEMSFKINVNELFEKSQVIEEVGAATEFVSMLLNNLDKYATAAKEAAKLIDTVSLKVLSARLHTTVLTILENTCSFAKTENGFEFNVDLARAITYINSLSGEKIGDVLGINAIDKVALEGAIAGVLNLPVKPIIDMIPVKSVLADVKEFIEEHDEIDNDIISTIEMYEQMYDTYYDQFKEMTIFEMATAFMEGDTPVFAVLEAEIEEETEEEETEEKTMTALEVAQMLVSYLDTTIPVFEIPAIPEEMGIEFTITTDKYLVPTGIKAAAMGYEVTASATASSTVDKTALKAYNATLPENYISMIVEKETKDTLNCVAVTDENGNVTGYKNTHTCNGSYYSESLGRGVDYSYVETTVYDLTSVILAGSREICNVTDYMVFVKETETNVITEESDAALKAALTEEEYAEAIAEIVGWNYTDLDTYTYSFATTEDGVTYVNYGEHDYQFETNEDGTKKVTTSADGVVETTKYTCTKCGDVAYYYYNTEIDD